MNAPSAPFWREKLIAAAQADFDLRARLAKTGDLFDGYNPEMEALHLANAMVWEEALDAIGWPGPKAVGSDGAAAAFLILQHAISRPDLQRRGLEALLEAAAIGQANVLDAAYLSDRIAVFEGRGQVFGTQMDWDAEGVLSPAEINDPEGLDERRASVGLPPLDVQLEQARAHAAAEGHGPPMDLAARRIAFAAWAIKVGWRKPV
jgi:hypothetical protein